MREELRAPKISDNWIKRWLAPASNGSKHLVALTRTEEYQCDCIGWIRHFPRIHCRHILMVLNGELCEATESEINEFHLNRLKARKTIKYLKELSEKSRRASRNNEY